MDKEHRESVGVQVYHFLSDIHCYLVLDVVVGLIVVRWKRSSAGYKEVHVHVVVDTVADVHVVAVSVVLIVVIVVVVVVLVGIVDNVGSNSGGNDSSSEITPYRASTAA